MTSPCSLDPDSLSEVFSSTLNWHPTWTIIQRDADGNEIDRIVLQGNLLVNVGITELLNLLSGIGGTAFGATAQLGVGDSSTAASSSQTDLQSVSNKLWVTVTAAPTISAQTVTWSANFTGSQAEWAWMEVGLMNSAGVMLNRFVNTTDPTNGWGNKSAAPGATWTLVLQLNVTG